MFMRESAFKATKINEEIQSVDIFSIKNDSYISGTFALGCGSIQQKEYYVCFVQYQDGGFKRDFTPTDRAIIYEKANVKPQIQWTMTKYKCHWLGRFGFDQLDIWTAQEGDYRFVVPE